MSFSGKAVHRLSMSGGQEAFFEGHVHAFTTLGGVPAGQVRYDNLEAAVANVIGFSGSEWKTNAGQHSVVAADSAGRGPVEQQRPLGLVAGHRRGPFELRACLVTTLELEQQITPDGRQ